MKNLLYKYWYLICVLPFLGFWTYGLTDLDEGFYGAVTMDMLRRGDWITPTLNGTPWFEKPILAYWLSMPFVSVMPNEFGARLPSFLCTMATLWILYRFVKNHFSPDTAILTCLVYSTSLLVVAIGRMMMTDAPLVLCLTIAFTTFYDSIQGNQKLRLITATSLGFAVLAKGPVALVLFGLIGIFSFWRLPDTRKNWGKYWLPGTLILAAIVATWYVPCYLANGQDFIDKFLIEQNIGRFKGGDTAHALKKTDPLAYLQIPSYFLFYPLTLALSSLAWIIPATRSKWWRTTNTDQSKNPLLTYLLIWFMVVLVFFSISATKLVHYVLPCIPPLAILIANALLTRHPRFSMNRHPGEGRDPQLDPAADTSGTLTSSLPPREGVREGSTYPADNDLTTGSDVPDFPPQEVGKVSRESGRVGLKKLIINASIASVAYLAVAQYAFYTDWSKRFKDVQSFAIEAREKNLDLYESKLGRSEEASDAVTFQLNETGHPSLGFYYRKPILPTEERKTSINTLTIAKPGYSSFRGRIVKTRADGATITTEVRGDYLGIIIEGPGR